MTVNAKQPRRTAQRQIILDTIRRMPVHPTADEVYRRVRRIMPRISLGTVYRNLDILTGTGQIVKLEVGTQSHYDGTLAEHAHILCRACGRMDDVSPEVLRDAVELLQYADAAIEGYEAVSHRLYFIGTCRQCTLSHTQQPPDRGDQV